MSKSIKQNFLFNILLNISKVIFPLVTAPYVSRVLEPDGLGLSNFANTYANWFAMFAALGIPFYGLREVAKIGNNVEEQTKFVSEIISISVISTMVCSIIMFLTLLFVPQLNENYIIFLVAGILLYTTPFKIDWYFSGKEDFGFITLRSLIIKTLSVILLFVFVHEKSDLLLYVALNASCLVLNEIWNFAKLYQHGIHPHFSLSGKRHLKHLLILFSSSVAVSIYSILDTLMLGFLSNYSEVGYYNCATHISKAMLPIATSLAAVVIPRLSQYMKSGNWLQITELANKSLSIVSFLCFPLAIGMACIAPTFVPLFLGEQYYGAILPLQIVVFIVVSIGLNNLTGVQILVGLGFDNLFLYSVLVGSVSNFILNIFLIPSYGASGAAFASVFAETIILFVTNWFVSKKTPIRFVNKTEHITNVLLALLFIPITCVIRYLFNNWMFVFLDIFVLSIFYIVTQYIFNNPSERIIIHFLSSKLIKH